LRADEAVATPKVPLAAKNFSARWKLLDDCDEALAGSRSAGNAVIANAAKSCQMACEKRPIHRHFCDFVICLMKMPMPQRFLQRRVCGGSVLRVDAAAQTRLYTQN
jgi:hypothetical protein